MWIEYSTAHVWENDTYVRWDRKSSNNETTLNSENQNGNPTCGICLAHVCHWSWEERKPGLSNAAKPSCQKSNPKLCPQKGTHPNSVIMGEKSRIIMVFFSGVIMETFTMIIALTANWGNDSPQAKISLSKFVLEVWKKKSNSRKSFELDYYKYIFHINIST